MEGQMTKISKPLQFVFNFTDGSVRFGEKLCRNCVTGDEKEYNNVKRRLINFITTFIMTNI